MFKEFFYHFLLFYYQLFCQSFPYHLTTTRFYFFNLWFTLTISNCLQHSQTASKSLQQPPTTSQITDKKNLVL